MICPSGIRAYCMYRRTCRKTPLRVCFERCFVIGWTDPSNHVFAETAENIDDSHNCIRQSPLVEVGQQLAPRINNTGLWLFQSCSASYSKHIHEGLESETDSKQCQSENCRSSHQSAESMKILWEGRVVLDSGNAGVNTVSLHGLRDGGDNPPPRIPKLEPIDAWPDAK